MAASPTHALVPDPERATQGFVANLSWLRQRPALLLIEVAWRWIFGVPATLLLYREGSRILAAVPWQSTGITDVTANQLLTDPSAAAVRIGSFFAMVEPGVLHTAQWLTPLLLVVWALASGVGRSLLLRRMDPSTATRLVTLIILQFLRVLPFAVLLLLWWLGVQGLARYAIAGPIAANHDPSMMLYVGGVIALTLALFSVSALTAWVVTLAPILSVRNNIGVLRSLQEAVRVGGLRSGLVEINLVLGVVKIALLVLAMVFSACPLPFSSVMTDQFLLEWNITVAIWYCLASDFFHVARVSSYLRLWQAKQHGTA